MIFRLGIRCANIPTHAIGVVTELSTKEANYANATFCIYIQHCIVRQNLLSRLFLEKRIWPLSSSGVFKAINSGKVFICG